MNTAWFSEHDASTVFAFGAGYLLVCAPVWSGLVWHARYREIELDGAGGVIHLTFSDSIASNKP